MLDAIKKAVAKTKGRYCKGKLYRQELEDANQTVVAELLDWLQGQPDTVELDAMSKFVGLSARRYWRNWLENKRRMVSIEEYDDKQKAERLQGVKLHSKPYIAVVLASCPEYIPAELADVAKLLIMGLGYRTIAAELGITIYAAKAKIAELKKVRFPDKRLQWYSASSDIRKAKAEPAYSRVIPQPNLRDFPPAVAKWAIWYPGMPTARNERPAGMTTEQAILKAGYPIPAVYQPAEPVATVRNGYQSATPTMETLGAITLGKSPLPAEPREQAEYRKATVSAETSARLVANVCRAVATKFNRSDVAIWRSARQARMERLDSLNGLE